jgi:hypothetical protein
MPQLALVLFSSVFSATIRLSILIDFLDDSVPLLVVRQNSFGAKQTFAGLATRS